MKWPVYLAAAAVLVLLASAVGVTAWYVFTFDLESVSVPIENELTKLVGREVKLGAIRKGAGLLRPHIEVDDLVVFSDPVTRSELARIDRAQIGFDLLPLLRNTLRIDSIAVRGVQMNLSTDADGNPLWPLHLSSESSGGGRGMQVDLEEIDLHEGDLVYHDGKQGGVTHAVVESLEFGIHAGGRIDLSLVGEIEGLAIRLEGRVAPPSITGSKAAQQIALEGQLGA